MQRTSLKTETNDVYFIRRVGDSLTACVTTSPPVSAIRALSAGESNYFITSDSSSNDLDIDPSILLDQWLQELDSASMVGANWIFKLVNFQYKSISRTLKVTLVIQTTVLPLEESIKDGRWET